MIASAAPPARAASFTMLFVLACAHAKPIAEAPAAGTEIHFPVPLIAAHPDARGIALVAAKAGSPGVITPVAVSVRLGDEYPRDLVREISEALGFGTPDAAGCSGCVGGQPISSLRIQNGFIAGDSAWIDVSASPGAVRTYCAPKDALCEPTPRESIGPSRSLCIALVKADSSWRIVKSISAFRRIGRDPKPRCERT